MGSVGPRGTRPRRTCVHRSPEEGALAPDKGASLSTYFIGACARGFWTAYRDWHQARTRHLRLIAALPTVNIEDAGTHDLDLRQDHQTVLRTILKKATPEQKAICAGLLQDKTQAEIGDDLGLTARGVEGRMYQLRRTSWDLVRRGRIDPALVPGSRAADTASRDAS